MNLGGKVELTGQLFEPPNYEGLTAKLKEINEASIELKIDSLAAYGRIVPLLAAVAPAIGSKQKLIFSYVGRIP